jgi:hypothetical protein
LQLSCIDCGPDNEGDILEINGELNQWIFVIFDAKMTECNGLGLPIIQLSMVK